MGDVTSPAPTLLLLAVSSRYAEALDWTERRANGGWGRIALASPAFEFRETDYYRATMGDDLLKQFLIFEPTFDPGRLAEIKLQSNDWEAEYATLSRHPEPRPLNLDPGYLTLAKLVLASTKDHAHRIYLGRGIYAEITLGYRHGAWRPREWTYPDYQRADFQAFFDRARGLLAARLKEARRP